MKKITLYLTLALVVSAVSACQNPTANQPTNQAANQSSVKEATQASNSTQTATLTQAPTPKDFRFSQEEMHDIANPNKLAWRVFYDKPSTGEHAKWFDAVKRGDLELVKYMVENGQDLEAKDTGSLQQTALGWAAFIGYEDMTDYLISKGASLHATDTGDVYNVLKSAVLGKNTAIVKKIHALLEQEGKVDLNDQTVESDGETLVMVAASNNRLQTVEYLIARGANVNLVSTVKDQSPLSFACDRGHVEMQQLLIKHGAVNHRTGKQNCQ